LDELLDPELVAQPGRHRLPEYAVRPRERLETGEQETLELDEWLLEEDDIVQFGARDPPVAKQKSIACWGKA
jgi:hypothetical protein